MISGIDIDAQTVVLSIIGGTLIAFATTLHLMLFGRLTGMSSILNSFMQCYQRPGFMWKFGFFCGLLTSTYGVFMVFGYTLNAGNIIIQLFDKQEDAQRGLSVLGFTLGGFLVGFGTKLGNGCTSSHGICGLPRFSARSWIAVITFVCTGMLTATMRSYYPVLNENENVGKENAEQYKTIADFIFALLLIYFVYDLNVSSARPREKLETIACFFIGFVYGLGLSISGMCRRTRVLSFLSLTGIEIDDNHHIRGWNPSMAIVMLTAVLVNIPTFNLILKQKPMFADNFDIPKRSIDWKIVVGPAIFGIGWGLTGVCPGPAMINVFFIMQMLAYLPFMTAGTVVADFIFPEPKQQLQEKQTSPEDTKAETVQEPYREKAE